MSSPRVSALVGRHLTPAIRSLLTVAVVTATVATGCATAASVPGSGSGSGSLSGSSATRSPTAVVLPSGSTSRSENRAPNQQSSNTAVEFDGVPVAVTVIDGAGAVKILDGGTLGALDPAKHAGAPPDPGAVLRRLEKLEPMAATLLPRSGQRHLYFGMLTGVLGRWHAGQALAYLRLADGPVCSPSQPMPSDGSPHLQQEVLCHVGVLAPLDDPTAEGVTIEGVY